MNDRKPIPLTIAVCKNNFVERKIDQQWCPKWVGIVTVDACKFFDQTSKSITDVGWSVKIVHPNGTVQEVVSNWLQFYYDFDAESSE